MIPELRGAAFALALAFPTPLAYLGEGDPPRVSEVAISPRLLGALSEPIGVPLALHVTLAELELLRTPRGPRTELRNVRTEDRR